MGTLLGEVALGEVAYPFWANLTYQHAMVHQARDTCVSHMFSEDGVTLGISSDCGLTDSIPSASKRKILTPARSPRLCLWPRKPEQHQP